MVNGVDVDGPKISSSKKIELQGAKAGTPVASVPGPGADGPPKPNHLEAAVAQQDRKFVSRRQDLRCQQHNLALHSLHIFFPSCTIANPVSLSLFLILQRSVQHGTPRQSSSLMAIANMCDNWWHTSCGSGRT
jgi:hypothetical protein